MRDGRSGDGAAIDENARAYLDWYNNGKGCPPLNALPGKDIWAIWPKKMMAGAAGL
jgi:hypothetical protein